MSKERQLSRLALSQFMIDKMLASSSRLRSRSSKWRFLTIQFQITKSVAVRRWLHQNLAYAGERDLKHKHCRELYLVKVPYIA